ncbi:EF-hand domain-containing protein [Roseimaritima sediminicola]|uniref:hypothetical protein n=1 Tax=Roseimaritima sediminicola TaxID=2662066 RepID=UPI00138751B1|nr:hypothetical protein [Roseimaritima sediminicola]
MAHAQPYRCTTPIVAGLALIVLGGIGCSEPVDVSDPNGAPTAEDEPQIVVISDPDSELGRGEGEATAASGEAPPADTTERSPSADDPRDQSPMVAANMTAPNMTEASADMAEAASADRADGSDEQDDSAAELRRAASEPADDPDVTTHRLYVPTTAGALLIDVQLRVDGQPIGQFLDKQLDRLQAEITSEPRLLWSELVVFARQNAALFPAGLNVVDETAERFDRNANGVVEREELRRWLLSANNGGRLVRVQTDDRFRHRNRCGSAVFAALDSDDDQVLREPQYRDAAEAILSLDRNFDERLDVDEWLSAAAPSQTRQGRGGSLGGSVSVLQDFSQWDRLTYAATSELAAAPFGAAPLLARIDTDGDQQLTVAEIRQLRDGPATLAVQIDFSTDSTSPPSVSLLSSLDSLKNKTSEGSQWIAVRDETLQLLLSVEDTWSQMGQRGSDQLPLWLGYVSLQCGEASDAWFHWLDRDGNGYLSSRELQRAGERIGELADADRVSCHAVPDAYTIRVLRQPPQAMAAARMRLTRRGDPQRSPLPGWAAPMDRNADGDLSRREFVGSPEQFDRLDRNQDGFIDVDEAKRAGEL